MRHALPVRPILMGLAMTFGAQALASGEVYYENDFEKELGFRKWAIARNLDYTVHEFGLSEEMAHSGKKSVKLSVSYKGGGYTYFRLPLSIRFQPDKTYYVSAWMYVKDYPAKEGTRVQAGLGVNTVLHYGRNFEKDISGCRLFHYFTKPTREWTHTQSRERRQQALMRAVASGQPTEKMFLDNVYIGIQGGNDGSKVTVYVDDLKVTSEPIRDDSIPVTFKAYPIHKQVFPYGHYSKLQSWGRRFLGTDVPPYASSWRIIHDWKSCYANAYFSGVQVFADSDDETIERLKTEVTIAQNNNLYTLPNTYFTRYYKPKLSKETCEKAIRRIIPQFAEFDNILGWSVIDEPQVSRSSIQQYLWAKRIFEQVDPKRPATTGASNFGGHMEKYKAISVFDRYPLREKEYNPWQIADVTRLTYRMANGPVYPIIQAFGDNETFQSNGEYRRPTASEMRLMTWGALANGAKGIIYFNWCSRPCWTRVSNPAMTDPFGKGDELLGEFRSFGKRISAVGPLLLSTELDEKAEVKVACAKIEAAWEVMRDVVQVGVCPDKERARIYLIPYSNDPKKDAAATLTVGKAMAQGKQIFDLETLKKLPAASGPGGLSVKLSFAPGDGKFLLLASGAEFGAVRKEVLRNRFRAEREVIKYDLYLAELSGLAKPDLIAAFRKAADLDGLEKVRARLNQVMKDAEFVKVRKALDGIQDDLSRMNRIIVENVTARESLLPKHVASRFLKREFSPADPAVNAYLDQCLLFGDWYFATKTMFLMGKYKTIAAPVAELEDLVRLLADQAGRSFVKTKKVEKLAFDAEQIAAMERAVAKYKAGYRGVYPNTKHLDPQE
jgi:hypothetical protein